MRTGRLLAVAGLLAGSLGVVIGIHSGVAGACPVGNNDGTVWGTNASVTPIGADVPGFFDVDGDSQDDVTKPDGVSNEQWPGDTNGVANDEALKTVYVDDRDFTANFDDTLGPGTSPTEATLGQNISVVDDKSGDEGGFWLYVESNGMSGLQRGGKHVIFEPVGPVPDEMDQIIEGEVVVLPPGVVPLFPEGITLFADDPDTPEDESGFPSGGSLSDTVGETDPCNETDQDPNTPAPAVADSILF